MTVLVSKIERRILMLATAGWTPERGRGRWEGLAAALVARGLLSVDGAGVHTITTAGLVELDLWDEALVDLRG